MWPNSTNTNDNVYDAVKATVRVHPVHLMNADWAPTFKQSQSTWPISPSVGSYHQNLPLPFISSTQPKSWYSFYHPMEGGRLSRPRHCSKGVQLVSKAAFHSVYWDKHNCSWPLTPQLGMVPLDRCDLQRHMGVNNLPKVVTRHRSMSMTSALATDCYRWQSLICWRTLSMRWVYVNYKAENDVRMLCQSN